MFQAFRKTELCQIFFRILETNLVFEKFRIIYLIYFIRVWRFQYSHYGLKFLKVKVFELHTHGQCDGNSPDQVFRCIQVLIRLIIDPGYYMGAQLLLLLGTQYFCCCGLEHGWCRHASHRRSLGSCSAGRGFSIPTPLANLTEEQMTTLINLINNEQNNCERMTVEPCDT